MNDKESLSFSQYGQSVSLAESHAPLFLSKKRSLESYFLVLLKNICLNMHSHSSCHGSFNLLMPIS